MKYHLSTCIFQESLIIKQIHYFIFPPKPLANIVNLLYLCTRNRELGFGCFVIRQLFIIHET